MKRIHPRIVAGCGWQLALLGVLGLAAQAAAQALPDQPRDYVVDLAGVVDRGTFDKLNGYLQDLERQTGAQLIVLTVQTTGGVPIRDYGLRVAEQWKLGLTGKDNGALVVIAIQDRQWSFEIGYGLEAALPDSFCGRVGRDVFVPHFKRGAYAQGILEGTLVLANRVAEKSGVRIEGLPARALGRTSPGAVVSGVCLVAFFGLLLLSVLLGRGQRTYRRGRHTQDLWLWLLLGALGNQRHGRRNWGGGWSSGGGWGGGFGSGGFGGGGSFGGGGGGSFGGGGASGGW